jgi:hypothetical protein
MVDTDTELGVGHSHIDDRRGGRTYRMLRRALAAVTGDTDGGAGTGAGPAGGVVFGEGDVSDVVAGFHAPVLAGQPRQVGAGGLGAGQAGDGVDARGPALARARPNPSDATAPMPRDPLAAIAGPAKRVVGRGV